MAVKKPIANYSGTLKELQSGDTLPLSFAAQTAATFFAGPTSGSAATPTFRAISMSDLGTGTPSSSNFLRGDGSWQSVAASPAGSDTQIQFNNSGSFGASAELTFNGSDLIVGGGASAAKGVLIGDTDPSNGAWLRNDGGNTVLSTKVGNIYYGIFGTSGIDHRFYAGSTPSEVARFSGSWLTLYGIGIDTINNTGGTLLNFTNNVDADLQFAITTSGAGDKYADIRSSVSSRIRFAANATEVCSAYPSGAFGVGTGSTSPSAKFHVVATTEQSRLGYDGSNYFSTTVGSSGGVTFDAVGSGAKFTFSDSIEVADAKDIVVGTSTGTKIGTSTSQKLGFFNATPVTQRADIGALTDSTGGTPGTTIQDVGGAFDQDTLNDNFASLAAQINALRTEQRDLGFMA